MDGKTKIKLPPQEAKKLKMDHISHHCLASVPSNKLFSAMPDSMTGQGKHL